MWTAECSGNTVAMIRDDWRLRYNRSTPKRERERGERGTQLEGRIGSEERKCVRVCEGRGEAKNGERR